jgi:hypothetical protein
MQIQTSSARRSDEWAGLLMIGVTEERFFGVEAGKFVNIWVPVMMSGPGVFTNPDASPFRVIGRMA